MANSSDSATQDVYRYVDDSHRRTTELTRDWLLKHLRTTTARSEKLAFMSASFARFCSPPDSALQHLFLASRYCVMFFVLDDEDNHDLVEHHYHVEQTARAGHPLCGVNPTDRIFDEIVADLYKNNTYVAPFVLAWSRTCAAFEAERRHNEESLSLTDLLTQRQDSIAVHPYIQLWYLAQDISLTIEEDDLTTSLRRLVAEQVILCNDLGSVEHDKRTSEGNVVLAVQRERGLGEAEAFACVVERYNQQNMTLAEERARLLQLRQDTRWKSILSHALSVVDGNLRSMQQLVKIRYGERGLEQLSLLSSLWD